MNSEETIADALAAAHAMLDEDSWIDEISLLDEDGNPDDAACRVVRVDDVRSALDRIEAAAKREQDKPGNAAALREALVAFVDSIQWLCDGDERGIFKRQFAPLLSEASAALADPARNCDRFADCNSAWKAYNAIVDRERLSGFDFWLFSPAEGGKE